MQFQYFKPSAFLSPYIKYYWSLESSASEGDVKERVIPTGNIEIMFHFKNSFIIEKGNRAIEKQPRYFIGGISSSYADVSTCGEAGMIAVTFYPAGACNFFRLPMCELTDKKISLESIYTSHFGKIYNRLEEEAPLHEKILIIEEFLKSIFCPVANYDSSLLNEAISLINQSGGQLNASALAGKLSVSQKSLERKFSCLLGKTPKQFAKIVRFQHALLNFSGLLERSFTQLAMENGYYDQPHFINDFKTFTGFSPREYFALHSCNFDYLS
jgi:AraC-like DNA-binding protein